MSRAFTSENDGWNHCTRFLEDCMMANEHGKCILDYCRQYPEKDKRESNQLEKNDEKRSRTNE